jgi:hypothetical protein
MAKEIIMRCLVLVLCLLAGCAGPAQKTEIKNTYKVDYLFEQDGCRIYRFEDNGELHYFITGQGEFMTVRRPKQTNDN